MKKTVTTLLVVATVFLCSTTYVYASTVTPAPLVYATDTKSYLNGDLEVFTIAEIDNAVMTEYGAHVTSNILQGTTHDFYYDADYVWDAPMQVSVTVVNNSNKYVVVPNGALYNNWTMTYTDYSNNGQNTQGSSSYLGYYIEDNFGVVYQTTSAPSVIFKSDDMFYADDVIIEPGQNKTYQYTVHFCFKAWTHNNATIYDPFDCNISVVTSSVLSGINDAYESTINDFINADDIPYSVIAYLNALVSQGIEDQQLLDQIIALLMTKYPNINEIPALSSGIFWRSSITTTLLSTPFVGSFTAVGAPRLVSASFVPNDISQQIQSDQLYAIDYYCAISLRNETSKTYELSSLYMTYDFTNNVTSNADYVGCDVQYVILDGLVPYSTTSHSFNMRFTEKIGSHAVFPSGYTATSVIKLTYFYSLDQYASNVTNVTFSYNAPTISLGPTSLSSSEYSQSLFYSIAKNFADIRDLLIGNKQNNDDISDQVADNQSQEDAIHAQEEQWYQDNETAITAVGLSNYQFSGDQTSGLSGVTSQFTSVWNALDGWTNVYIFVLTLSLATFILRHRPSTKDQQRRSDYDQDRFINTNLRMQRDSAYRHQYMRYKG